MFGNTSNSSSSSNIDYAQMLSVMESLKQTERRNDVILMLASDWKALQKHCDEHYPVADKQAVPVDAFLGTPIEVFLDKFSMMDRAFELFKQGKKVMVCE